MSVLCLFEIDPETKEATGTVVPFCSETCLNEAKSSVNFPGHTEGVSGPHDFGFVPRCAQCGTEISSARNTANEERNQPSDETVEYTYYLRRDAVSGMLELRQTRFREQLKAGTSHPHDICAYARNKAEMEHMVALYKLGSVDWGSIPD